MSGTTGKEIKNMKIVLESGREITSSPRTTILETLKGDGVYLTTSCAGNGTCGKCKVLVKSGSVNSESSGKLSETETRSGYVLACTTSPEGDIHIEIPKESIMTVEGKIAVETSKNLLSIFKSKGVSIDPLTRRTPLQLPPPTLDDNISDMERFKRELAVKELGCMRIPFRLLRGLAATVREDNWNIILSTIKSDDCDEITNIFPGGRQTDRFGVAVDIGTTTLALYLIDLEDGNVIDVASTYNSQMRFGDDVITRIVQATENNELDLINMAVINDINNMLTLILNNRGIDPDKVDQVVVAGNPTMTQLFLSLDPSAIREEPYVPTANTFPLAYAGELKLKTRPSAPVYIFPSVASYVGGDIVSGVLASGIHKKEELSLFMDIGTNGEIVLGNSEFMVTAACSAGPCFEGSGIKHGMRATEGAIENIKINRETRELTLKVVGDTKPIGICGSGMIDAISEMFLTGILDQKGKLHKDESRSVRFGPDGLEYLIYAGEEKDIVLAEPDIENILRAKAAIHAGIAILLSEVGFTFDDIQKVYIAGGFGKFLDIEKAIILGMLPDMPREKFEFLGNTSIVGAYLCSLSRDLRDEAEDIASKMTYLELSTSSTFMDEYVSGLFIPHTNIDAFPTVKALIEK